MGINKALKGERKIDLGGATFTMRPTFAVLTTLEDRFGSLFVFIQKLTQQANITTLDITLADVAFIIHTGISGSLGDRSPSYDEVGQWIAEAGVVSIMAEAVDFITSGMVTEEQADKVRSGSKQSKNKGSKASKK